MTALSPLELTVRGYRLTSANICFHLPDHPKILQEFIWQDYDLSPRFPVLHRFLGFWEQNIDGKLHSVRVWVAGITLPSELKYYKNEFTLN